jgi:hypothetical protein
MKTKCKDAVTNVSVGGSPSILQQPDRANGVVDRGPVGSILSGTEDIINECLFGDSPGKRSYRHTGEAKKLIKAPADFDAGQMVARLLAQIEQTTKGRCSKSISQKNWREVPQTGIGSGNTSKEVRLERAIAKLGVEGWWNQMPIAAGLVHSHADLRRAIDLVHCNENRTEFDFIELKIDSDNPLYALMEIVLYGLVYLSVRREPAYCHADRRNAAVLTAKQINLRVLAPKGYFHSYNLHWLHTELQRALEELVTNSFSGNSFALSVSSHWPNELPKWEEGILTNPSALRSLLEISSWQDAASGT